MPFLLGILLLTLCLGIGCGDFTLFGDNSSNKSPTAVATADNEEPTACETHTVTLDGTGSTDPDGDILTYQWQFTDRPTGSTAALTDATTSEASFQPDVAGEYAIELTVQDPGGRSDTDSVTVTAGSGPVANAGDDQSVSIDSEVTLNGGDSKNPDQDCTTDGLLFSWSLEDPAGDTSDLDTAAEVTFTADMEGTYTATLTVETDTESDSDTVEIQVSQAAGLLDSLEAGPYLFTVKEVTDGIVFGALLETLLPQGTTLDENVEVPSTDDVPPAVQGTISLTREGASVVVVADIDRKDSTDQFYTLTGTASGTASISVPQVGTVSCQLTGADCSGQLTPVTATSAVITLTVSNPEVNDACSAFANKDGTIEITLSGVLQTTQ